jgi:hypothetical protein
MDKHTNSGETAERIARIRAITLGLEIIDLDIYQVVFDS